LASVAAMQSRIAMYYARRTTPSATFTRPEIAAVGVMIARACTEPLSIAVWGSELILPRPDV
jgi:pyruvate/2-oxoglutarate dehydrogenase complex dihydrolipoamide dehydrogenase (E3) component